MRELQCRSPGSTADIGNPQLLRILKICQSHRFTRLCFSSGTLTLLSLTRILSLQTGYQRDYSSGAVYKEYFASPNLMFPVSVRDSKTFKIKDYVFGIRDVAGAKAWPVLAFSKTPVINDQIGERRIVLIGNAKTRTVRAYERKQEEFKIRSVSALQSKTGGIWKITETHLIGPTGQKLRRIDGILSYWFAWDQYMGLRSEYYDAKQ